VGRSLWHANVRNAPGIPMDPRHGGRAQGNVYTAEVDTRKLIRKFKLTYGRATIGAIAAAAREGLLSANRWISPGSVRQALVKAPKREPSCVKNLEVNSIEDNARSLATARVFIAECAGLGPRSLPSGRRTQGPSKNRRS